MATSQHPDIMGRGTHGVVGTPKGPPADSTPLAPYLGLDVLLGGRHQAGAAQPQHHHDGEEEAGGQDPARKARAPVTPRRPPPKNRAGLWQGSEYGKGVAGPVQPPCAPRSPAAPTWPCSPGNRAPAAGCPRVWFCPAAPSRGGASPPSAGGLGGKRVMLSPGTRCNLGAGVLDTSLSPQGPSAGGRRSTPEGAKHSPTPLTPPQHGCRGWEADQS